MKKITKVLIFVISGIILLPILFLLVFYIIIYLPMDIDTFCIKRELNHNENIKTITEMDLKKDFKASYDVYAILKNDENILLRAVEVKNKELVFWSASLWNPETNERYKTEKLMSLNKENLPLKSFLEKYCEENVMQ